MLKRSSEATANVLQNLLNESLKAGILPDLAAYKAKCWYSDDINKNPIYLFILLQLNVFFID